MNQVKLTGRLTYDPELRYTTSGTAVCSFSIAVERDFVGNNGTRGIDFVPVVVWSTLGEECANRLRKGSSASVDGRINTRSYDDREGRKVRVVEVVADKVQFGAG